MELSEIGIAVQQVVGMLAERNRKYVCAMRRKEAKMPKGWKYGCERRLAEGQYWHFCGETDMGQSGPVLCTECGGKFKLHKNQSGGLPMDPLIGGPLEAAVGAVLTISKAEVIKRLEELVKGVYLGTIPIKGTAEFADKLERLMVDVLQAEGVVE